MAERRMFAKTITGSDAFLEMPHSTQCLYFHLAMRGDDDGFINSPKGVMREVGCREDDIKLLIFKKFIIPFESGVVVIKHWKIHNYIQSDRYNETKYKDEKTQLVLDENKAYRLDTKCIQDVSNMDTKCIQDVSNMDTQVRLGKDNIDNNIVDKPQRKENFSPPSIEEVKEYCLERQNNVDWNKWHSYYSANGWKVGRNKMKDWRAAVRTWEKNDNQKQQELFKGDATAKGLAKYPTLTGDTTATPEVNLETVLKIYEANKNDVSRKGLSRYADFKNDTQS